MPEHPEVAALQRDLGVFNTPLPRCPLVPPALPDELFDRQCRVYVFTDGGAIHGSDARFTRCGGGAFWGRDHSFKLQCPLWGPVQGPGRAEQYMILAVLEVERRPVHLSVDNDAARLELALRLNPCTRPKYELGKHSDICSKVRAELDRRAPGEVAVAWVKGHATQAHVDLGLGSSPECRQRNDAADALATAALEVA